MLVVFASTNRVRANARLRGLVLAVLRFVFVVVVVLVSAAIKLAAVGIPSSEYPCVDCTKQPLGIMVNAPCGWYFCFCCGQCLCYRLCVTLLRDARCGLRWSCRCRCVGRERITVKRSFVIGSLFAESFGMSSVDGR